MAKSAKNDKAKDKAKDKAGDAEAEQRTFKQALVEELKFIAGLIVFLFFFLNFIFGHYKIPSESMQPTLEVGDHLYVSKFSYGFSRHSMMFGLHKLPFLKDGRIFSKMPKRGISISMPKIWLYLINFSHRQTTKAT